MTDKQVTDAFNNDYIISKRKKADVNAEIERCNDLYEGKPYGNEVKNHSPMVWKIIQKQGETLVSNLSKPFISGDQNVMISPVTDKDVYKAKIDQGVLNHYHDKVLDKNRFYKDMSRVMVKEGTAWVRIGWNRVNKRKSIFIGSMTKEQRDQVEAQGFEAVIKPNGWYIEKDNVLINQPTAEILKNGRVYTDPLAEKSSTMRYLIYEYETGIGDLRAQESLYTKEVVDKIAANLGEHKANYFEDNRSGIESAANGPQNYVDDAKMRIKIYEYWTDMDIDNDGVPVPCVATFAALGGESGHLLMKLKKNPYPFKKIPFVAIPLVPNLYSVWGKAIAPLIEDIQYIYTMLMRGVVDNTAGSNNNVKFVKKGALDPENHRRLMDKEPVVEVNTTENINTAVMDGGYNQIPSSIFNLFQLFEQEAEAQTGVSKMMQGISGAHMNAPANNFSATLSMSQIRLLDITQNINYGMKEVLEMWMAMALEYLSDDEIKKITGIDKEEIKIKETQILMQEYGINDLPPEVAQRAQLIIMEEVNDMFSKEDLRYDIRIKVGTDGVKEVRINQLNMLMQQMGSLGQMVDPLILKDLLAEYADLMDFPVTAEKIRDFTPQPDPTAEQLKQIAIAKAAAEAKKEDALAENANARADQVRGDTANRAGGNEADIAKKYADIEKLYSDIQAQQSETNRKEFETGAKAQTDKEKVDNDREAKQTGKDTKQGESK